MRVAIVGAGLQCGRRAPVVKEWPGATLVSIASLQLEHAKQMAGRFDCEFSADWRSVVARKDIDAVLVCTPPHVHAEIGIAAMRGGKHVLCEKPMTRTVAEAEQMLAVSRETGFVLKCGFNHRHHPAIRDAKQIVDRGELGRPLFARCRYGICGRPGYEAEWRADPAQAAGGQFIEQGTHAIDLFRWFLGEIAEVTCMTGTQYFKQQSLDDNGMAVFRARSGAMASLHASLTQWKNQFSFEVFGEDGYVVVEGLGASYGTEKLVVGKRDFNAPFNDHVTEYRGGDTSWKAEWKEFVDAIKEHRQPVGSGEDGLAAMRIALAAYEAERRRVVVTVNG
jgi:predicted dehydrogenase